MVTGNIEKQVPRPSEEGHGARSDESDVGRCGHAACVVTAVYSFTAVALLFLFFSDPAPGRTSGNRGNIEKQVPRPSEEGHGARSGESDVGRCGHAARYDLRSATSPRDIQDLDSSVRDADCGVRTGIVREKGRA